MNSKPERKHNPNTKFYPANCDACGGSAGYRSMGEINRNKRLGKRTLCSDRCRRDKRHDRTCPVCFVQFRRKAGRTRPDRGKYCSRACYNKWQESEENKGENNPNWKNGNGKHDKERKAAKYSRWREAVYKRDNHTCRICMVKGGYLHAHHIKIWSKHKDLRYELDNGITLCRECHFSLHHSNPGLSEYPISLALSVLA